MLERARQYCTIIGLRGPLRWFVTPRKPDSGRPSSSRIILGIARTVGSHFDGFQNLLIRSPIRKTTNSPSSSAVTRFGITFGIELPFASTERRLSRDA